MKERTIHNMEEKPIAAADVKAARAEAYSAEQYPLWSVLVFCYKNQNKLFGMLDSIFRQDYPRIQLIVSDDGSRDFDAEAVRSYIEENRGGNITDVIVRKNSENMKTVAHVKKVLELAGDNIVLTAADDRFASDSAITQYQQAFLAHPDALWLVARCDVVTADYQSTIYVTPTDADIPYFEAGDAKRLFSRWSRRGMAVPCSMAFRRTAFEAVGGIDISYTYLEDWPLVLKLLRNGFAPAFLPNITAAHSRGGVTNTNAAYGKAVRRAFYEDKHRLFEQEVEPYLDMLEPEDLRAYRLYRKEIFDRAWFLDIEWEGGSRTRKLKLALSTPQHFFWVLEQQLIKRGTIISFGKLLLVSQLLLLVSCGCFMASAQPDAPNRLLRAAGWADCILSMVLVLFSALGVSLSLVFRRKQKMRRRLVN